MEERFYYLNEANEPIGPFDAEQLRKLRESEFIGEATSVCVEGSEDWRPYSATFPESPPDGRPDPPPTEPSAASEKAPEVVQSCPECGEPFLGTRDEEGNTCPHCEAPLVSATQVVQAWKTALWASFFAVFVSYKLERSGWFVALIPVVIAVGLEWRLVFRIWKLVPSRDRTISPARAFGFLLIPVFNFYWAFRMFRELGRAAGGLRLVLAGTVVASVFVLICLLAFLPIESNDGQVVLDLFLTLLWAATAFVFYAVIITRLSKTGHPIKATSFLPTLSKGPSFQLEK